MVGTIIWSCGWPNVEMLCIAYIGTFVAPDWLSMGMFCAHHPFPDLLRSRRD